MKILTQVVGGFGNGRLIVCDNKYLRIPDPHDHSGFLYSSVAPTTPTYVNSHQYELQYFRIRIFKNIYEIHVYVKSLTDPLLKDFLRKWEFYFNPVYLHKNKF